MVMRGSLFFRRLLLTGAVSCIGCSAVTTDSLAQRRLALAIGNSNYTSVSPLRNPVNDATDIAGKLKSLRFEVVLVTDADHALMRARLHDFASRVTDKDIALVFYAGHGITVNGESFLLPVDVPATLRLPDASDQGGNPLDDHLIGFSTVLQPLQAAKLGIVFLDACRTGAAKDALGLQLVSASSRSLPILRGNGASNLRPSAYSAGVFRAYATQLDNVADDGKGRNSPFTRALLQHIGTRGITIQELMIRIRRSVMQETNNKQIPWEEAALNESFSFTQVAALPPSSVTRSRSSPASGIAGAPGKASATIRRQPAVPRAAARPSSGGSLPPGLGVGAGAGL